MAFGPKNLGLDEEEIERRVRRAIEMVGLDYDEVAEMSPFELSGGMKRRAAIAGVIAMEPEMLILDEPMAGLDPAAHRDILAMIKGAEGDEYDTHLRVPQYGGYSGSFRPCSCNERRKDSDGRESGKMCSQAGDELKGNGAFRATCIGDCRIDKEERTLKARHSA